MLKGAACYGSDEYQSALGVTAETHRAKAGVRVRDQIKQQEGKTSVVRIQIRVGSSTSLRKGSSLLFPLPQDPAKPVNFPACFPNGTPSSVRKRTSFQTPCCAVTPSIAAIPQ